MQSDNKLSRYLKAHQGIKSANDLQSHENAKYERPFKILQRPRTVENW